MEKYLDMLACLLLCNNVQLGGVTVMYGGGECKHSCFIEVEDGPAD